MSTDYTLIENGGVSATVWEHSCNFDLCMESGTGARHKYVLMKDLSLEQLKELNQQLTNVISYFDPDYKGCEVKY